MSPRGRRIDPPKPVLQEGSLGFVPLNALSATLLHAGHGEAILDYRQEHSHTPIVPRTHLLLGNGKQTTRLELEGVLFHGFADALYREKLPGVILAYPSRDNLDDLLTTVTLYIEQLLSLGFFMQQAVRPSTDPFADVMPRFVLAGDGLLFSRLITGVARFLSIMENNYPLLDETLNRRILGRFLRAIPLTVEGVLPALAERDRTLWLPDEWTAPAKGEMLAPCPMVLHYRLAGGNRTDRQVVEQNLRAHGLNVSVEDSAPNSPERLELSQTWQRLSQVILPEMAAEQHWEIERLDSSLQRVREGLLAIGRHRNAIQPGEESRLLPVFGTSKVDSGEKSSVAAASTKARKSSVKKSTAAAVTGFVPSDDYGMLRRRQMLEDLAEFAHQLPPTQRLQGAEGQDIFTELAAQLV